MSGSPGSIASHPSRPRRPRLASVRDGDIRYALIERLQLEHAYGADTRIWPEFSVCLGEARVDVGLVSGSLSGFEIKSAADNLARLPRQVAAYSRCLDFATLVVEDRWHRHASATVPDWWGVMIPTQVGSKISFKYARRPRRNPRVEPFAVAQLLWRDEAAAVVMDRGICDRTSRMTRWTLWDLLAEHLPLEVLSEIVRNHLRARPSR